MLSLRQSPLQKTSEATPCTGVCAEQAAAVEAWQGLWQKIAAGGEQALAPESTDRSLRPAGDTVFMRYRGLWRGVDKAIRQTFQLAALANEPEQKLRLLTPLSTIDQPLVRFRALLEIARVRLRLNDLQGAHRAAVQALALQDRIDARAAADAHFILGYIALTEQHWEIAETALTRAIAADPGYWDARQAQLLVLGRLLARRSQSAAACLDRTRRLIEHLGALPALAQSRTQLRDIADRFESLPQRTNAAFYLLAGLGYSWAGDSARARQTLKRADRTRGRLPAACEKLILAQVQQLLARHFSSRPAS